MTQMTNAEAAAVLDRYGRLMELAGENAFRVRAFVRAAETVRDLDRPFGDLARSGNLRRVSGIGPAIAAALTELASTGEYLALRTLEADVPATLLDVVAVPGLGAKTASRLFHELGIADLDALTRAADAGHIRALAGLGAKTEERILAGIAALARRSGRHRLGLLLPAGRRLVATIGSVLPPNTSVALAGSVRRMEETGADLDLVVGVADTQSATRAIEEMPEVARSTVLGMGTLRLRMQSGLDADVFVVRQDAFGTALVRATGPEAHLDLLGDPLPVAPDETAVYAALGMAWIPPELRQGRDEVALARAGTLPRLVTVADIRGEFHSHTTWSDGAGSVAEMAAAARAAGYDFLGISDHTRGLGVANGLDAGRLAAQRTEIASVNPGPVRIFAGAEVEVARDGRLDFDDPTLAALDVVIASLHVGLRQPRSQLTERLISVLENPHVDIVAHPSGRLIERREGGDFAWDRVFASAAHAGTALEINADPARLDLNGDLARQALAAGCLLTINGDAHHPSFAQIEYGVATARRAGASAEQILNCWSVDQVSAWLADRGGSGR
ncbi:MAG: DNA polymerase X family [uncultured Thermomicrobiales bacterium]|uniref:DNA polymerase X family n=1 Tax=uncultured Thermomicrobiales bacterium TaxID=1645740 RepID=A0A6J4TJN7_9BACT|nr:MAG: DNA polymerase X family [uncultured Thermomicrobiales bacterium]